MRASVAGLTAVAIFVPAVAMGQASQSEARAKQLTALMTSQQETALAAKDDDTGAVVAALLYPGVQLLVVSARPDSTEDIDDRLTRGEFEDVYAMLMDGALRNTRLFFQDLDIDGLHAGGKGSVDVTYDRGRRLLLTATLVPRSSARKPIGSDSPRPTPPIRKSSTS